MHPVLRGDGPAEPAAGPLFRLLLLGYFEGLDSERGDRVAGRRFAQRCAASSVWTLAEAPPEHSTISRTRRLIDLETHQAIFTWVLQGLATRAWSGAQTIGIDGTTLEANAALRSIVRRDTGESYAELLDPAGGGVGDRDADARRSGAARSEAAEEGPQRGVGASARS